MLHNAVNNAPPKDCLLTLVQSNQTLKKLKIVMNGNRNEKNSDMKCCNNNDIYFRYTSGVIYEART